MTFDVAVVGAGIAGLSVARELVLSGLSVAVSSDKSGASHVPNALLHPFPGRSANRHGVVDAFVRVRRLVEEFAPCEPVPMVRPLSHGSDDRLWRSIESRRTEAAAAGIDIVLAAEPQRLEELARVSASGSAAIYRPAYGVDAPALLDGVRAELARRKVAMVPPTESIRVGEVLDLHGAEIAARRVVLCLGDATSEWFPELKLARVAGEMAIARCDRPLPFAISQAGHHFAPHGHTHVAIGATRRAVDETVTRDEVLRRLFEWPLVDLELEVEAIWSGIRLVVVRDRRPLVGRVPGMPAIFIAAGFGATGFLWAPHCAAQLAAEMCRGTPVDAEYRPERLGVSRWASPRIS